MADQGYVASDDLAVGLHLALSLGRPVTLVEFPGQGHGVKGLANNLAYYRAIFDFLDDM